MSHEELHDYKKQLEDAIYDWTHSGKPKFYEIVNKVDKIVREQVAKELALTIQAIEKELK